MTFKNFFKELTFMFGPVWFAGAVLMVTAAIIKSPFWITLWAVGLLLMLLDNSVLKLKRISKRRSQEIGEKLKELAVKFKEATKETTKPVDNTDLNDLLKQAGTGTMKGQS